MAVPARAIDPWSNASHFGPPRTERLKAFVLNLTIIMKKQNCCCDNQNLWNINENRQKSRLLLHNRQRFPKKRPQNFLIFIFLICSYVLHTPCQHIFAVRDVILQHDCVDPPHPGAPLCVTSQSVKQFAPFLLISCFFWCPGEPPALMRSINTTNAVNPCFPA